MKPTVYLMLGLTGSGKSTFAKKLAGELGIECFSFDSEYAKAGGNLKDHRWDEVAAEKTYDLMKAWMTEHLKQSESVILDYCPWEKDDRDKLRRLIELSGATSHVFYFDVNPDELLRRLSRRNESTSDSQYVTREMLDDFVKRFDVPTDENVEVIKESPPDQPA